MACAFASRDISQLLSRPTTVGDRDKTETHRAAPNVVKQWIDAYVSLVLQRPGGIKSLQRHAQCWSGVVKARMMSQPQQHNMTEKLLPQATGQARRLNEKYGRVNQR
jgi:hypothetical protein